MTERRTRVERATDAARFLATDQLVWFQEVSAAPVEQQLIGIRPEHRWAASVEDETEAPSGTYAGVYGVYPLTLAVPGPGGGLRHLPCAGLSWVGVHPDRRRRGVLSAMIRHHLEQVRDAGGQLSALHASEPAIYGRYGYGLASLEVEVVLARGAMLTAPDLDEAAAAVTTSMVTSTDPGVPERLRASHLASNDLGGVVGEVDYYERLCTPLPEKGRDKEPWRLLFARRDGADAGVAAFRRVHKWEKARPAGELRVWTVQGDPATRLALLRRLVDFDLMGTVHVESVGIEDPLVQWVGGPRATSDLATYDGLWVRLVDLPGALQARTWSAACDVVVEVEDAAAPWNAGCWRVRAGADGEATVESTTAASDVRLPVTALGGAYLGGGNLLALLRAGLVTERRPGAVAELWRAMRTDLAPGPAVGF